MTWQIHLSNLNERVQYGGRKGRRALRRIRERLVARGFVRFASVQGWRDFRFVGGARPYFFFGYHRLRDPSAAPGVHDASVAEKQVV